MPLGKVVVVIVGAIGAGLITMLRAAVVFPAIFSALTVKLNVPAAVGVPDINPVDPFKPKPVGRLPTDIIQLIGAVPVALSVWLYD